MRNLCRLVAFAVVLTASPALAAAEKPDRPKERKVCRTVHVSGRTTPQRICRKVERPSPEAEDQRDTRNSQEAADRRD